MKNTKNPTTMFDTFVSTQKEIYENFVTASKKVQEGMEKSSVAVDAVAIYKDWASKQEKIAEKMTVEAKKEMKFDEMPATIKDFVATQEKFAKNWVDYVKNISDKMADNKAVETYKQSAEKMYEQMSKNYNEMFAQMAKMQPLAPMTFFQDIFSKDSFEKALDMWKQMIPAVK